MKKLITLLLVLVTLNGYSQSKEVIEYHEEVANHGEISKSVGLRFYKEDVKIFVDGKVDEYLKIELDNIIKELNELIDPINIYYVDNKQESNMDIYFGDMESFMKIYKLEYDREFIEHNWGAFWIYPKGTTIILSKVFIDTERTNSDISRKHLLREEVTQALGLRNDSYKYSDSMFYAKWKNITAYSNLDKEIIKYHYNVVYD